MKQLEHNSCHAAKMAGPADTFEWLRYSRRLDISRETRRINIGRGWQKNQVAASRGQGLQISFERPGIGRKILVRAKLRWVDENRGDDDIGSLAGNANEAEMALVQCPHCGHDADAPPFATQLYHRPLYVRGRENHSHSDRARRISRKGGQHLTDGLLSQGMAPVGGNFGGWSEDEPA